MDVEVSEEIESFNIQVKRTTSPVFGTQVIVPPEMFLYLGFR